MVHLLGQPRLLHARVVLTDFISESACVVGRVYRLRARNLRIGVYVGERGFVGIREKFAELRLDTEYHFGEPGNVVGTAIPIEDLGPLPDGIVCALDLGTRDSVTGRDIHYVNDIPNPHDGLEGVMGWWAYTDTGEVCPKVPGCLAHRAGNAPLFAFLKDRN